MQSLVKSISLEMTTRQIRARCATEANPLPLCNEDDILVRGLALTYRIAEDRRTKRLGLADTFQDRGMRKDGNRSQPLMRCKRPAFLGKHFILPRVGSDCQFRSLLSLYKRLVVFQAYVARSLGQMRNSVSDITFIGVRLHERFLQGTPSNLLSGENR